MIVESRFGSEVHARPRPCRDARRDRHEQRQLDLPRLPLRGAPAEAGRGGGGGSVPGVRADPRRPGWHARRFGAAARGPDGCRPPRGRTHYARDGTRGASAPQRAARMGAVHHAVGPTTLGMARAALRRRSARPGWVPSTTRSDPLRTGWHARRFIAAARDRLPCRRPRGRTHNARDGTLPGTHHALEVTPPGGDQLGWMRIVALAKARRQPRAALGACDGRRPRALLGEVPDAKVRRTARDRRTGCIAASAS